MQKFPLNHCSVTTFPDMCMNTNIKLKFTKIPNANFKDVCVCVAHSMHV